MRTLTSSFCISVLGLLGLLPQSLAGATHQADVVVYGGTAGGVVASVAAARMGAKVVFLEPGNHVGGMLSGGLGYTDFQGQEQIIGRLASEVLERIGKHLRPGQDLSLRASCGRDPDAADRVFVEGYVTQPVQPWDIPYRALTPRFSECVNLLVLSALP